jgi:hypothetical protein
MSVPTIRVVPGTERSPVHPPELDAIAGAPGRDHPVAE